MLLDRHPKFGLAPEVVSKISAVFRNHPQIRKVVLYGSRAKGNYRAGSDIDLTMEGEGITMALLLKVGNELDDLLLSYKIDLSFFRQIDTPELAEHIRRVGLVFYERNAQ